MSSLLAIYNRVARKLAEPDFILMAGMGRIQGYSTDFVIGVRNNMQIGTDELIWDQGGLKVPIPSPTKIFVSSSDAGDNAGQIVLIRALDTDFKQITLFATLNGQTQVEAKLAGDIETDITWIQNASIINVGALGDIYIATTSTLTAGVPDNTDTIQQKILIGKGTTRSASYMVPAGMAAVTMAIRGTTDDTNKAATILTEITPFGQPKLVTVEYTVTPAFPEFTFPVPVATINILGQNSVVLPEKTIVEFIGDVNSNNTRVFFGTDLLLVEVSQFN